jgi:hypothetical protein
LLVGQVRTDIFIEHPGTLEVLKNCQVIRKGIQPFNFKPVVVSAADSRCCRSRSAAWVSIDIIGVTYF